MGKLLPRLRSEAVPGELQDLEAQSQEDGVFISYRTHENSQHHCLERKTGTFKVSAREDDGTGRQEAGTGGTWGCCEPGSHTCSSTPLMLLETSMSLSVATRAQRTQGHPMVCDSNSYI